MVERKTTRPPHPSIQSWKQPYLCYSLYFLINSCKHEVSYFFIMSERSKTSRQKFNQMLFQRSMEELIPPLGYLLTESLLQKNKNFQRKFHWPICGYESEFLTNKESKESKEITQKVTVNCLAMWSQLKGIKTT